MQAFVLVSLRSAAMAACAVALMIAVREASQVILPPATSFDGAFDRLGTVVTVGVPAGFLLGAALTHRLGHRTFGTWARVVHALLAAVPALLILLGLLWAIA